MAKKKQIVSSDLAKLAKEGKLKRVIQHESLPPELLERIGAIWKLIRDGCYEPNIERFEAGFLCDAHPEKEVAIWEGIAKRYSTIRELVSEAGLTPSRDELVKLQGLIVAASTGATKPRGKLLDIISALRDGMGEKSLGELMR